MANLNPSSLFIEFNQTSATIAFDGHISTHALQHQANGLLTPTGRDALKEAIRSSIADQRPAVAYCAIGIRGVSLRTLQIPPSKPENLRQILSIQIEKEFPIAPDKLAWGFKKANNSAAESRPQEIVLVAVKKEFIEDYAAVLTASGIEPIFTVGILSIAAHATRTSGGSFAVLNIGSVQTEIVLCENGTPSVIRTFPLGTESDVTVLANRMADLQAPNRVFLIGTIAQDSDRTQALKDALGSNVRCETLFPDANGTNSAAVAALQELVADSRSDMLLALRTGDAEIRHQKRIQPLPVKWMGIAAALLLCMISLRYVEPLIRKPVLEAKIAEAKAAKLTLPPIEEELDFLRHLEGNRPGYLNAVTVLADAIPRGTKFEALTLDRRGEFTFRANVANSQQATDLRAKLLESGLFSTVVLEEQTPAENNRKLIMRIGARWKTDPKTPSKTIEKIVADSIARNTNAPPSKSKG